MSVGYLGCDFPRVAGSNEHISPQLPGKAGPRPQPKACLLRENKQPFLFLLKHKSRFIIKMISAFDPWLLQNLWTYICFDFVFPESLEKCKASLCLIAKWEGKCGGIFQGMPLFNSQAALTCDYMHTQTRVQASTLTVTHWEIMHISRSFFQHDECFPCLQTNTSNPSHWAVGGGGSLSSTYLKLSPTWGIWQHWILSLKTGWLVSLHSG